MKTRRFLLSLALLGLSIFAVACQDHLEVQGLPASCKDQSGADAKARVEMKIYQNSEPKTGGTTIVNPKGVVDFKIGASTQSQSLLKSGHRPAEKPDVNAIYTADPVTIELKFKDPCKIETKKLTAVLDDLPHERKSGRVRYTLKFDQFKP
jgi:hypothetical protein